MKGADYYDKVYLRTRHYRGPPEESPYYPLWKAILELIGEEVHLYQTILDVGCGPGQFGQLCVKAGHVYTGVDYSPVAIELAKAKKDNGRYYRADIRYDQSCIKEGNYTLLTGIEFFEHITKDIQLVQAIPKGKRVIITGPSYDSVEHVRYFPTVDDLTERYEPLVNIHNRLTVSGDNVKGEKVHIHVIEGIRK